MGPTLPLASRPCLSLIGPGSPAASPPAPAGIMSPNCEKGRLTTPQRVDLAPLAAVGHPLKLGPPLLLHLVMGSPAQLLQKERWAEL
jgi:hypothetical protein